MQIRGQEASRAALACHADFLNTLDGIFHYAVVLLTAHPWTDAVRVDIIVTVIKRFMVTLISSVLGRVVVFTLFIIWRFYTVSETPVRIRMVQILVIKLLTSINPS